MNQPAAEQILPVPPRLPMLRTLGLVAAISGFLVVLTHQLTTPLIEENKRIAIERALFKVVPGAVSRRDFLLTPGGIEPYTGTTPGDGMRLYAGYNKQGRLAGLALEASAQGYQDVIRVLYGFDPACQCIRGVQVLKMAETPGIGDKIAKDPDFLRNFEALDARPDAAGGGLANAIVSVKAGSKTEAWQIDSISGATISSRAVARMLDDSAQQAVPVIMRHLESFGDAAGGTP
jgi:electron transport complex protein RnfG